MTRAQLITFALLVVLGVGGLILWERSETAPLPLCALCLPLP